MNGKPVTVVAQIKAQPGKELEVRNELVSLLGPGREDTGCINYDLHQARDNPGWFLFHENWASETHLDQHLQQPHVQRALNKLGTLVAEPPQITLWQKIG